MKNSPPRRFTALLIVQLLLVACSATAHSPPAGSTWPEPKPVTGPGPVPAVRVVPNFQAPSATHCARPVQTREVPGRTEEQTRLLRESRERVAKSSASDDYAGAPATSLAPAARAEAGGRAASPAYAPQPQVQPPPSSGSVTAGVVDDNADFTGYLAFRNRTKAEHRARDIRERYLLEVKDPAGRGIADAEVAVRAASGHAMWARTDAAGKVWLHPDAFDPSRASQYDIAVRKDGRQSAARLTRGQKSSVEVVLNATAAQARARLDLVFLVDATGSMADEIDKLKTTLRSISAEMARLPSQPDLCFGLVAYRDKGDAFLLRSHDLTNDLGGFLQGALNP
ncbi:MAG: hypothetical protein ABIU58_11530, partial [Ramlibacter sp.]